MVRTMEGRGHTLIHTYIHTYMHLSWGYVPECYTPQFQERSIPQGCDHGRKDEIMYAVRALKVCSLCYSVVPTIWGGPPLHHAKLVQEYLLPMLERNSSTDAQSNGISRTSPGFTFLSTVHVPGKFSNGFSRTWILLSWPFCPFK